MAKKLTIQQGQNLQGGLRNLIQEKEPEAVKEKEEKKEEPGESVKTFTYLNNDLEFLNKYVLYRGYKTGKKYTIREAIHDAIEQLRAKHPEV